MKIWCTFEECKKLKELGLPQESLVYYLKRKGSDKVYIKLNIDAEKLKNSPDLSYICSAFNIGELIEFIKLNKYQEYGPQLRYDYPSEEYLALTDDGEFYTSSKHQATAAVELLIYLIKKYGK